MRLWPWRPTLRACFSRATDLSSCRNGGDRSCCGWAGVLGRAPCFSTISNSTVPSSRGGASREPTRGSNTIRSAAAMWMATDSAAAVNKNRRPRNATNLLRDRLSENSGAAIVLRPILRTCGTAPFNDVIGDFIPEARCFAALASTLACSSRWKRHPEKFLMPSSACTCWKAPRQPGNA